MSDNIDFDEKGSPKQFTIPPISETLHANGEVNKRQAP